MSTIYNTKGEPIEEVKPTVVMGETQTATAVVEEKKEKKEEALFIQTPIFLLFAEYLGYVTKFIELAENWCDPKKPMPSTMMKTFLEREARSIYDMMLEKYTEEQINELYVNFYPLGLDDCELDLNEKRKANGDDLPF